MPKLQTIEVRIAGMDCAECTQHVQQAIAGLPGVAGVDVFLASEKAVVALDPEMVSMENIRSAVSAAGYSAPLDGPAQAGSPASLRDFNRRLFTLLGLVFGAVMLIIVLGEWLGLLERVTDLVPLPLGALIVLVAGFPIFRNVARATLKRQVISHTLMSIGAIAALVVGQWATAVVVVFFMRIGDYAENFTTERARKAVKDLNALAPETARIEKDGETVEIPVSQVRVGETVVVRPGENIPVDGEVIDGQATVNQASITGESMPVDVGAGSRVFAATIAELGSLRVRVTQVGAETTFGRVIKLVEQAEANRANVQRIADKFSAYYLPVVSVVALLTFLIRRDPLSTAAVLVVACSCSFALATPIAMLASIGAGAKRGLLIKGGKYLELLERADVLLIDKTGTVTLGKPQITDVVALDGASKDKLLTLAASAERYSEHPLAEAVRRMAVERELGFSEALNFKSSPGLGVEADVNGVRVAVGNRRLLNDAGNPEIARDLEAQGKTLLFVLFDGKPAGILAAADTLRPEVPEALKAVKQLGIKHVELLTGDNQQTAATLAGFLGVDYRANLLPENKIEIVREYQAKGHIVIMVGDGVNDAPALAQANIGIAMGAAGSDIALEAAHVALMREDWMLVPEVLRIAKRTLRVVRANIAFTVVYNILGLSLAAIGILPPILAAAAQSLPDLGILANSARLLKQK